MAKKPKQTPLQRDVEYVLDAQFIDEIWGRRFLRRLVREAVMRTCMQDTPNNRAYADRIARELIPSNNKRGLK